jgi:hypothetical protein
MESHSLEHVSVWLEGGQAEGRAFSQALDWAYRLGLPLRAVVTSQRFCGRSTNGAETLDQHNGVDKSHELGVTKMKAWGTACAERGVTLEMLLRLSDGDAGMKHFLRPHGLCVCPDDPSSVRQEELLRRSIGSLENAVLLCGRACRPITRVLVLYDQPEPNPACLENVANICQALEIHPIILIVAKSESEARLRQGYAGGVCNSFRLLADFDFVVGSDLRSAVGRVASWRNCSHLIIEHRISASWWNRSATVGVDLFRGLLDSLSLLALPSAIEFDLPHRIRCDGPRLLRKMNPQESRNLSEQKFQIEVQS